jgi:hypothetical protein
VEADSAQIRSARHAPVTKTTQLKDLGKDLNRRSAEFRRACAMLSK